MTEVNKKVASQIAYLSYAYGYSVFNTKELNNTYWNSITSEKSKIIDELIDNKMRNEYDNVDKLYKMTNILCTLIFFYKLEELKTEMKLMKQVTIQMIYKIKLVVK